MYPEIENKNRARVIRESAIALFIQLILCAPYSIDHSFVNICKQLDLH